MRPYTKKGHCSTCGKIPIKDCTERMFFMCASSEYQGALEFVGSPPDWWIPMEKN